MDSLRPLRRIKHRRYNWKYRKYRKYNLSHSEPPSKGREACSTGLKY
jgi:hypothetical protein